MAELPAEIAGHLEEIKELCEKHGVTKLMLLDESAPRFGGDVPDFVVEFEPEPDPIVRGRRYAKVWAGLLEIVGGDLNLVVESTIENPWRSQALAAHHDIYAAT
jgi:hypothetical protein